MGKDSGDAQAGADAARYASDAQSRSAAAALAFAQQVYGSDKGWREKTYADQFQMLIEQQRRARQQYAQQIQYRHPFVYAGQSAATGLMQLLGLQNPAMPGVIQESQFGKGAVSGFPYQYQTSTSSPGGGGGGGTGGGSGGGGGGGGSTPVDCATWGGAIKQAACCRVAPDSVGCKGDGTGGGGGGGSTTVDCTTTGDAFHKAACCAAQPDSVGCQGQGGEKPPADDPCAGLGAMGHAACCAVNRTAPSCASGSYSNLMSGGNPTTQSTSATRTMTDPDGNTKQVPASLASFYEKSGWS